MNERRVRETEGTGTYQIWVKKDSLEMYREGQKAIEVRVGFPRFRKISEGFRIVINRELTRTVVRVAEYSSVDELLANEDSDRIDLRINKGLMDPTSFFKPEMVERFGLLAFELED